MALFTGEIGKYMPYILAIFDLDLADNIDEQSYILGLISNAVDLKPPALTKKTTKQPSRSSTKVQTSEPKPPPTPSSTVQTV